MEIATIIEVVKRWVEDETGPGFSYHIGHCDDLTSYYDLLKEMLEDVDKNGLKEKATGTAYNVDGGIVVEVNRDWPNELKDQGSANVNISMDFVDFLENNDEGE